MNRKLAALIALTSSTTFSHSNALAQSLELIAPEPYGTQSEQLVTLKSRAVKATNFDGTDRIEISEDSGYFRETPQDPWTGSSFALTLERIRGNQREQLFSTGDYPTPLPFFGIRQASADLQTLSGFITQDQQRLLAIVGNQTRVVDDLPGGPAAIAGDITTLNGKLILGTGRDDNYTRPIVFDPHNPQAAPIAFAMPEGSTIASPSAASVRGDRFVGIANVTGSLTALRAFLWNGKHYSILPDPFPGSDNYGAVAANSDATLIAGVARLSRASAPTAIRWRVSGENISIQPLDSVTSAQISSATTASSADGRVVAGYVYTRNPARSYSGRAQAIPVLWDLAGNVKTIDEILEFYGIDSPGLLGTPKLSPDGRTIFGQGIRSKEPSAIADFTSWVVHLPKRCSADVDDGRGEGITDGRVDARDLSFFTSAYQTKSAFADVANDHGAGIPDGVINGADSNFFNSHFNLGC